MTNLLKIEVTRPDQELVIMRGISGSGKSTEAQKLVGKGEIFSADTELSAFGNYSELFAEMNSTGNMSYLSKAHQACMTKSYKAMKQGVSPVVIDNTNLKPSDAKVYVVNALKLGFSNDNIKIVDLGTNGFTAEELASRNTHGVGLEHIQKMIQRHKSTSPMTLIKILEAKDKPVSDVLYSAVVIDEGTRNSLKFKFEDEIPSDWKIFLDHMTIKFGEMKDKAEVGKLVTLTVTHIGFSDMALAIRVSGYESKNEFPHITIAVNPEGGKPVMSNEITSWRQVKQFNINGIVTEVKRLG